MPCAYKEAVILVIVVAVMSLRLLIEVEMKMLCKTVLPILLAMVSGCMRNVDLISTFHVTGEVSCGEQCEQDQIAIKLLDTGLDHARSKKSYVFHTMVMNPGDSADHKVDYFWGYKEGFGIRKRARYINFQVGIDGYDVCDVRLYLHELKDQDGAYQINLRDCSTICNCCRDC